MEGMLHSNTRGACDRQLGGCGVGFREQSGLNSEYCFRSVIWGRQTLHPVCDGDRGSWFGPIAVVKSFPERGNV
jgi:hypothetical protein